MERVWLSIGSNLSNPLQKVNNAIKALKDLPKTRLVACSSYYRSRPLGLKNQPDFLNAVVALDTNLAPGTLLIYIQKIELCQGRIRTKNRFGPRTLDLDILLFGKKIIIENHLVIPHYDMYRREFVLYPLSEIAPDLKLPNGVLISNQLQQVPFNGLTCWGKKDV
ncbi:2-amino-4-hydroxy-6-hydroxymethyldihydropteridine diphosphokinase [Sodalis sp. CWE]|uniref:2-amino-4-hydroxy-6- hydroxymethyldihydropteridine diphosphokinase n=1 Tax=Sodalis sp. CWE TaxID=2803816 RepID=UPI001C7D12ED|nr:2-amino-4-hydroxy-6-hydroxymethyldihydropteridine diphosphokinase [Sodalis sp. CWE]MBX4180690.1 2-amino-4-hydroxy-6-hydroxymethyldihydropteridine diphosphokinase [Sodalis sp. CWE]